MKNGVYLQTPNKGVLKVSDEPLTVLELHRKLCQWSDGNVNDNLLDITDLTASVRYSDYVIEILEPYSLTINSFDNLYQGIIIKGHTTYDLGVNDGKHYLKL